MTSQRILIVEDHPVFLKGLSHLLAQEPGLKVVGEASSRLAALERHAACRPDLALVDLTLGEDNGLELIKDLMHVDPLLKVLVLSMHDERFYAERALAAGALGYCMKEEAVDHLIEAVRRVSEGQQWLSPGLAGKVEELRSRNDRSSEVIRLSDREFEVFTLLGQGLGTAEIAARLHLGAKTVDTHKEKIKGKLGLATSADLRQFSISWIAREDRP